MFSTGMQMKKASDVTLHAGNRSTSAFYRLKFILRRPVPTELWCAICFLSATSYSFFQPLRMYFWSFIPRALCVLVVVFATGVRLSAAPITAKEIDLKLRLGNAPGDIAGEILQRGRTEALTQDQEAKFRAGGISDAVLNQINALPMAEPPATPKPRSTTKGPTPHPDGALPFSWPAVGQVFPRLYLPDPEGKLVDLRLLKGYVMLIEYVSMSSAGCQALAGGNKVGPFECPDGRGVQKDLPSLEDLFRRYAKGVALTDNRIVFVQILLYGSDTTAPTLEQAKAWRAHFAPSWKKKRVVLVGVPTLIGDTAFSKIPGLILVDQNLIVRYDGTGHKPIHNPWTTLLPAIPGLLGQP